MVAENTLVYCWAAPAGQYYDNQEVESLTIKKVTKNKKFVNKNFLPSFDQVFA